MRRGRLAAALLGAGIAVTAFGGGGDADAARAQLTRASERTIDATSMRFEAQISIGGFGPTVEEGVEARADLESGDGEVVSRFDGYEVRVIVDGDAFWFTSDEPEFVALMPRGKRWVRGTFEELGDSEVISSLRPPALLFLLAGATDVVAERGGDRTTSYTFVLDLAAAIDEAPRPRRQEVRELMWTTDGEIAATGEAVVVRGQVRELVAEGTVDLDDESIPDTDLRWDATFDDIGDDVNIEPPDDDLVVELADVPEVQEAFFDAG